MIKKVFIVGASSRLGTSLTHLLVSQGYMVYAGYDSTRIQAEKFVVPVQIDVTSDKSCQAAVGELLKSTIGLDALIYLVGISPSGLSSAALPSDLAKTLDLNTIGYLRIANLCLPMLTKNSGHLIAVSSLSGLISFPNYSIYSASKHALRALVEAQYFELSPRNVHVTCILPGAISNPNIPEPPKSARSKIPLLRLLLPMTTPDNVSLKLLQVLQSPNPPKELLIGFDALVLSVLNKTLPSSIWNYLQKVVWQKQQ